MPQPQYTNMVNGTIGICRAEGVMGIYRGLWPTVSVSPQASCLFTRSCGQSSNPWSLLTLLIDHEARRKFGRPVHVLRLVAKHCTRLDPTTVGQALIGDHIRHRSNRGPDHCL